MQDKPVKICLECRHGRQRFSESCYCVRYGYIIGYSKTECRGYERDEVSQPEDRAGRNRV